jgi:hypothetical protein
MEPESHSLPSPTVFNNRTAFGDVTQESVYLVFDSLSITAPWRLFQTGGLWVVDDTSDLCVFCGGGGVCVCVGGGVLKPAALSLLPFLCSSNSLALTAQWFGQAKHCGFAESLSLAASVIVHWRLRLGLVAGCARLGCGASS